MIIQSPDPAIHKVEDYEFLFTNGAMVMLSLDLEAGDTIDRSGPHTIEITQVSKPSMSDPSIMLPKEEITLFKSHILSIQHRTREVQEMTPEQQAEWIKVIQETGTTIQ